MVMRSTGLCVLLSDGFALTEVDTALVEDALDYELQEPVVDGGRDGGPDLGALHRLGILVLR